MSNNENPEHEESLAQARQRISEQPASVVIANHVVGLYELAAIHLGTNPVQLNDASLAIDALAALIDTLGERLGDQYPTFKEALANIQMAFVNLSN